MNNFDSMGMTASNDKEVVEEKVFVRDESDNKLFPEIQVKDPLGSGLVREETVGYSDFDTPIYRIAQQLETKYLSVTCNKDPSISAELKNKTEFKGRTKKVSEGSWLGLLNTEREVAGLEPLSVEDFTLEEKQKLKYEEDKAIEQGKILVHKKLKQLRQQYLLNKIVIVLGEGSNFRNKLPTVRPYKGNRSDSLRPLLLKTLRKWLLDEMGAEMAQPRFDGEMIECDDLIEYYKSSGYKHYRRHGWFDKIILSSDKDSMNSAGMVINPDLHTGEDNPLKGKFKFPQMMLIEATDKCTGKLELVTTSGSPEVKGYGFKFLMYQCALGLDSADNYDALGHLKDAGYNLNFGVQSAYKVLQPCKTVQETLQKTIDTFAELLPHGVEYTDHKGDFQDVDTLTYMNTYFLVAYMTRSYEDQMDFFKLRKAFKVDTTKIENNNLYTKPYQVFNVDNAEGLIGDTLSVLAGLKDNELKSYKSLKKDGLVERLDFTSEKVTPLIDTINNNMFKWVQRNKQTGEIIDV